MSDKGGEGSVERFYQVFPFFLVFFFFFLVCFGFCGLSGRPTPAAPFWPIFVLSSFVKCFWPKYQHRYNCRQGSQVASANDPGLQQRTGG